VTAGAGYSPADLLSLLAGALIVGEVVDRQLPGNLFGRSAVRCGGVQGVEADALVVGDLGVVGVGDQLQV